MSFSFEFSPVHTDRSTTKPKTFDPCWNEIFIHEVTNAKNIGLTVFHDAALSQDDFIANCNIPFDDLAQREKEQQDFWVCVVDLFFRINCLENLKNMVGAL